MVLSTAGFGPPDPLTIETLLFLLLLLFFHHRPPSNTPTSGERPGLRPGEPYYPLGESDREHRSGRATKSDFNLQLFPRVCFNGEVQALQGYATRLCLALQIISILPKRERSGNTRRRPKPSTLDTEKRNFSFSSESNRSLSPRGCSAKAALSISY